jgi:carbamoyltransferase
MSYNILGINTSHNGSVCVLVDGKVDFFLEEDRITRKKHDSIPLKLLSFLSSKYNIDEIAVSGLYLFPFKTDELSLNLLITKFFPNLKTTYLLDQHHLTHAATAFFNSQYEESLCVVADGSGSEIYESDGSLKFETESIYKFSSKTPPIPIYKSYRTNNKENDLLSFTKVYEVLSWELGFGFLEAGKTMGLSSYGKPNPKIPQLYIDTKGNPDVFDLEYNDTLGYLKDKYQFLTKQRELTFDLAYKVQQESQEEMGNLIEKAIQETGLKQVCCSGGYFLNCVANYYLTKRFPDVEFYFEPISSDAGNAIGAAKFAWYQKTQDTTIRPQKTLYYGPKYSKEDLLKGIQKYLA